LPPASHIDTTNSASEKFGDEETEFEDDEEEEDQEGGGPEDDDDGEDEEDEDENEDDDNENDEYEAEEEDQSTLDSENINDSDDEDDNDEHDFKDEDDDSDDDFKDEGDAGNKDDDDEDEEDDDSNNEDDDSDTNDSDDDEDEDSGHQDFDEDLQLDSFLFRTEGLDSANYNDDDFPDEFDPWSKDAAETSPSEIRNGKQREQRGRGRIRKIPLPKGRSSRLFLLVVIALLCIGALVLILYFAGVGPFGTEEKTKPPTKAPSPPASPSPAPTITTSPSAFIIDPDALEIAVKPNYQAIIPSGMTTNVTVQSLSLDLIALMDALAPDVLGALESSRQKRMLRERRRNLQSYSVKLPTSIDEIYEIGAYCWFSFHMSVFLVSY